MPTTTVTNTIGAMIIRTSLMKASPNGCIGDGGVREEIPEQHARDYRDQHLDVERFGRARGDHVVSPGVEPRDPTRAVAATEPGHEQSESDMVRPPFRSPPASGVGTRSLAGRIAVSEAIPIDLRYLLDIADPYSNVGGNVSARGRRCAAHDNVQMERILGSKIAGFRAVRPVSEQLPPG